MAIEAVLTDGCLGKVVIDLNGPINTKRIENDRPYMSFSNFPVLIWNVHGRTFPAGAYTVSAYPQGKESAELTVQFTMVNC
jgi:hypothetical protein